LALNPFASATAAVEAPGWRARSITLALNSSECRRQPRLAGLAPPGLLSIVSMCPCSCVWTQASSTAYAGSRWVGLTHTSLDAALRLVGAGLGLAVLSMEPATPHADAGRLVFVPLTETWAVRKLVAIAREEP
jgi:DNA-binding transcriptional LysR family regulator